MLGYTQKELEELAHKSHEVESTPTDRDFCGFVYVIRFGDTDMYKIGFSTNVESRLRALQTACPIQLRPVLSVCGCSVSDERFLQRIFERLQISGEWFKSPAVAAFVDRVHKLTAFVASGVCDRAMFYGVLRELLETISEKDKIEISQQYVGKKDDLDVRLDREFIKPNKEV